MEEDRAKYEALILEAYNNGFECGMRVKYEKASVADQLRNCMYRNPGLVSSWADGFREGKR